MTRAEASPNVTSRHLHLCPKVHDIACMLEVLTLIQVKTHQL